MNNTTDGFKVALPDVPFMADMQALYHKLSGLTDYRQPKGVRYPLALLAVLALLAKSLDIPIEQKLAELDVITDVSGVLKIAAIRAK